MDWCFGVFGLVWFLFGCSVVDFPRVGLLDGSCYWILGCLASAC